MELQGTIKKLFETQTFPSGFQKREAVLLTEEQYPQPISIEFLSDKIDLLDNVQEGDKVKIGINIRGREWTNPQGEVKYFNSITAWKLEKEGTSPVVKSTPKNLKEEVEEEIDDDLPF